MRTAMLSLVAFGLLVALWAAGDAAPVARAISAPERAPSGVLIDLGR